MTPSSDPKSSIAVADHIARLAPFVLGVAGHRGLAGAALHWREGVFVAAASALGRDRRVQALSIDGTRSELEVIGIDADSDVAALRPVAGETTAATFPGGPLDRSPSLPAPRIGDFVFALAHDPYCGVQASFGRLGAVGGPWRSGRHGGCEMDARWRLDGGLYPGFEGALVADAEGRVLGVASSAFSRTHGVIVPGATVDRVLDALLRDGRIDRPYLGVLLQPARVRVDGDDAGAAHVDGALIASLAEGGPGDAGGLRVGDVVVGFAGQAIESPQALHRYLAAQAAGTALEVELVRGGVRRTLPLTIGTRPDPDDERSCGSRGHGHSHGHPHRHANPRVDGHDGHRARHGRHDIGERERARRA